jgi:DNA-binding transcriptional regulator LsrR (DeoR family)
MANARTARHPIQAGAIDHNRLLVKAARLYYEDELTQGEVAERLRISRQKAQRLISRARAEGIVQIAVNPIMGIHSELEKQIERCFGLREAVVIETSAYEDQPTVAREVGAGAAEYLMRILRPRDKIVLSWGRSILGLVNALSFGVRTELEGLSVIQGLGGLGDPNHEVHATELVRRLARALDAEAVVLPAPGVAGTQAARDAFLQDPYVAKVLELGRSANVAFMGIGAPDPNSLLVRKGTIVTWAQLTEQMNRGAVGDVNLRYFDQHGKPIRSELNNNVIGLTLAQIQRIQHVVGVAGGAAKLAAIRGALQGKLIHALVTDHVTARHLVDGTGESR